MSCVFWGLSFHLGLVLMLPGKAQATSTTSFLHLDQDLPPTLP